jgi:hypothetical protein
MPNLISTVGRDFFNRRFQGSFFLDSKKRPSIVDGIEGSEIVYTALGGSIKRLTATTQRLPFDFFKGLEAFSVPTLGWRAANGGRDLSFFSRNNKSYHRGLSTANLIIERSKMTKWLQNTGNYSITGEQSHRACMLALKPEFIPFTEGISKMREGKLLSFAASPSIAVMPDEDDKFSIYFRQNKAGEVLPDGTVVVDIPLLTTYVGELT